MPQHKSLTPNQLKELEVLEYFQLPGSNYTMPANCRTITNVSIVEAPSGITPIEAYFAITDAGIKSVVVTDAPRLYQLLDAKRWRHRHVEMYEDGVREGTVPYVSILEDAPQSVATYLSREMFKGMDRKLIMRVYKEVNEQS